ncbi:MAG TPA: hypothetical protein VFH48_22340 [Chloroflexota bacterium]|nr:hypothetical protein [Chloroflexota bacterium]
MAQIVTSARLWPVRPEEAVRRLAGASDGQSFTRAFYLGVSFIFAVLTYLAVQVIQLVGAMPNATATATDPLAGSVFVHATSLVAWVGACMLVGLVAHHYLARLGTSLHAEHRRGEKLALVSDVSGALTGPLPPAEIATKFLEKIEVVAKRLGRPVDLTIPFLSSFGDATGMLKPLDKGHSDQVGAIVARDLATQVISFPAA